METIEIEKIINNVDTAYEVQKELINVLNFVENLSAENIYLHKEVQN